MLLLLATLLLLVEMVLFLVVKLLFLRLRCLLVTREVLLARLVESLLLSWEWLLGCCKVTKRSSFYQQTL